MSEQSMSAGRPVKRHASGDPFLRSAANEILKRHATFPRVKWEDALAAISETLEASAIATERKPPMNELLELAGRCEKATGPSRDLDADISRAYGGYSETKSAYAPEPFTASLDAAMSLVPEGWAYSVGNIDPSRCRCSAWVMPPPYSIGADIRTGATPALALCAAALRARASKEITDE